jgi:hypothetical protein
MISMEERRRITAEQRRMVLAGLTPNMYGSVYSRKQIDYAKAEGGRRALAIIEGLDKARTFV